MKLDNIRIQQFRRFNQPIEFNNLDAGLNIFVGPNESGKSTIAQAIRVAFLERHNTSTLKELLPWEDSSAAPQVEIDFKHNNISYQLTKRFMKQKACVLNIDGRTIDGSEAENYLANLLGFNIPSRGSSQAKDWGIPGLLWVGQGLGQELSTSVLHANKPLQEILNSAVDNVSSYDGDIVLERINEKLSNLVTTSTRTPTKDYKKALDRQQDLNQQLQELNNSIDRYKKQVDRLDYLQLEHQKNELEKPWEKFKQQELDAQKKLQYVQQLKVQQSNLEQQQKAAQKSQELLHKQINAINEQRQTLNDRQKALDTAKEALQLTSKQGEGLQQSLLQAQKQHSSAKQQLEKQQTIYLLIEQKNQINTLNDSLKNLRQQFEQANKVDKDLRSTQELLKQLYVEPDLLQQIQNLQAQQSKLEIQHNALATRLKINLHANQKLLLDNKEITQDVNTLINQNTTIEVPGVASITVEPLVHDLQDIAVGLANTKLELVSALKQANATDLDNLWHKQSSYEQALGKSQQYQAMLQIHAPNGIEQIKLNLSKLDEQITDKQQSLEKALQSNNLNIDQLNLSDTEITLEKARNHAADTERILLSVNNDIQEHKLTITKLQTQLEGATIEYERIKSMYTQTQEQNIEKQALESLNQERAQLAEIDKQLINIDSEIKSYQPDLIEQDIQRFSISAKNQLKIQEQLNQEIIQIRSELRTLGAQGLEEKALEIQNQLHFVDKQVQQYKKTADNLIRIFDLLLEKKQALILKLHQPLIKHMRAYLQVMFQYTVGDNDIRLDENLMPTTILRQNINAPIEDLSFGAREQIGIISRLAYADLLAESGKPTLILLDDALLHSDDNRLQQAKRVLYDAATRHQILLFTCQPDKWRDAGVIPRQLN